MQFQSRILAAMLASLCASGSALATNIGISPTAGPVINPLNGQETQVWKLVGRSSGCTAFQITREWIMGAKHCAPTNFVGDTPVGDHGFYNALGHSAVITPCEEAPLQALDDPKKGRDMVICRLSNPSAMTPLASYPPLVADTRPVFWERNANALGQLLAYGRSYTDVLSFVGFDGLPHGFDPAVDLTGSTIPFGIDADSGGAVYWFSPTSPAAPGLTGVMTSGGYFIQQGTLFLTAIDTAWVVSTITNNGDPAPTVLTASQHYTGTTSETAPPLQSPPTFQGSGYNWTASWNTPSSGSVTSYTVSAGKNGALDRSFSVSAGTGNTANLTGLSAHLYRVCVRPVNSAGPAPAVASVSFVPNVQPWQTWAVTGITTANCANLDMRPPSAVGPLSFSSAYTAATGLYKITATWAPPSVPDITPKYRVAQTLTYASGPVRTSTTTTTSPSYNATNLPAGTKVCLTITAYSRADVLGTNPSSAQCFTAN